MVSIDFRYRFLSIDYVWFDSFELALQMEFTHQMNC